jgi:iron complex outermembrane receptor protein
MRVEKFSLETGLRRDFVKQYGFEWLPGVSVTNKANSALAIRLRSGLVYKTPSVFNEEAEKNTVSGIFCP